MRKPSESQRKDSYLSVRVPSSLMRRIEKVAHQEERSIGYVVRKAIDRYLDFDARSRKRKGK